MKLTVKLDVRRRLQLPGQYHLFLALFLRNKFQGSHFSRIKDISFLEFRWLETTENRSQITHSTGTVAWNMRKFFCDHLQSSYTVSRRPRIQRLTRWVRCAYQRIITYAAPLRIVPLHCFATVLITCIYTRPLLYIHTSLLISKRFFV